MGTCRLTVSVDYVYSHPLSVVYDALCDFGSYPEWWPSPRSLAVIGPLPVRVGSAINLSNTPFVRWTSIVVELRASKMIAMQYAGGALRGSAVWRLEPHDGSGTRLFYDIDVEPLPWWLRFIARTYDLLPEHRRQLRRIFVALDRRLAQLANHHVRAGAAAGRY